MKDFPKHYQQITKLMEKMGGEIPQTMSGFGQLHKSSIAGGAPALRVHYFHSYLGTQPK